uniref:Uncharacterized protein n=1 Tax=Fopius arisanus TaxID=64838 RepID=A0A0C9QD61_9HYME
MAYRGVKGSDPFVSKTSRNERFAQMSKQEQIIQQKKMEIQAKMQEMKSKQASESVKKSSGNSGNSTGKNNSAVKKEDEKPVPQPTVNLFANDGSFLDQFKKIAHKAPVKPEVPQKPEEKREERPERSDRSDRPERVERTYESRERRWNGEKNRDWERRERRRNETRWGRSSERRRSSSSSPSPPRHRSSPSPDARKPVYHQVNGPRPQFPPQCLQNPQTTAIPPLVPPPMIQMTKVPPPTLRTINPPVNVPTAPLVQMETPRMSLPPPHMIRPPPPTIRLPPAVPNTTVPPPSIPMQNLTQVPPTPHPLVPQNCGGMSNLAMQGSIPTNIPPNIPPNIPTNVPPPALLPPMTQMPPNMVGINPLVTTSGAIGVGNVQTVPNVPPPSVLPPIIISGPPPVHGVGGINSVPTVPPPNLNIPPPSVPPGIIPGNTGAGCILGPRFPVANVQVPPPVRPPGSSIAPDTARNCPVEAEQLARIVADCGDAIEQEVREKNAQDPKLCKVQRICSTGDWWPNFVVKRLIKMGVRRALELSRTAQKRLSATMTMSIKRLTDRHHKVICQKKKVGRNEKESDEVAGVVQKIPFLFLE